MVDEEEIVLPVKIVPKSSKNEIVGIENLRLKIRIAAAPEKGAANEELIAFISSILKIAKSNISISSGEHSRYKSLLIQNMKMQDVLLRLPILKGLV